MGAAEAAEGLLVLPHAGLGETRKGANPTQLLLVLVPVKDAEQTVAVVEIFQRPAAQAEIRQGYLKFLSQMCGFASQWAKAQQLLQLRQRESSWKKLDHFVRSAHATLEPIATAYAIANDAQHWLDCDRVSVALQRGKSCRLEAISGQDEIERRSDVVLALQHLTDCVMAINEPFWYPHDLEAGLPPQLENAIHEYVDQSFAKTVVILPLTTKVLAEAKSSNGEVETVAKTKPLGAIIVEQMDDVLSRNQVSAQLDILRPHCEQALAKAREHDGVFMLPLLRSIGKLRWLVAARTLPKTLLATIAGIALLAILVLVPAPFQLEGRGVLQPMEQRDLFVEVDGVITGVHVAHGDTVKAGQLLLELENPDLEVQLAATLGERQSTQEHIISIERMRFQDQVEQTEKNRLAGELLQLEQELKSLEAQCILLRRKRESLRIHSPASGRVVTWNVKQLLFQRPVKTGQVVLTVANPAGPWELEVFMPENRMGHIVAAQSESMEKLAVEYVVATDPMRRAAGNVRDIHSLAELHEEHGHAVSILVDVDPTELQDPKPGATVIAHVDCGYRAIGYVWLHEVFEFVESRILFNLW
jgi:hypothetical protein